MKTQKQLWEKLAHENPRYYINSDMGRAITEEEFVKSGIEDYNRHILDDDLLPKSGTFLEIGCGNGRMTEFIVWKYDEVIGTDISGEMIRLARERMSNVKNVKLFETDGESIPAPYESVDVAFSYLVFQHIKDRDMIRRNFEEVYRVLKPGGIFKVLMRTDKQETMKAWWSGVHYTSETARDIYYPIGFDMVKLEQVKTYAMWLWLKK